MFLIYFSKFNMIINRKTMKYMPSLVPIKYYLHIQSSLIYILLYIFKLKLI